MPLGRPLAKLTVSDADQQVLKRWAQRPKSANALATRARIILGQGIELFVQSFRLLSQRREFGSLRFQFGQTGSHARDGDL